MTREAQTINSVDVPGITTSASPYPSAVVFDELLHLSGQVALDNHGGVVAVGDIDGQVHRVLERIDKVLNHHGTDRSSLLSATVYLTDPAHADSLNTAWTRWFGSHRPARTTLVCSLLDPRLLIEITAVAHLGRHGGSELT